MDDLYFAPDELFRKVNQFSDPFAFINEDHTFQRLRDGYADDMAKAENTRAEVETEQYAVYILPEAAWANRVSGVFGNELARSAPNRAHALLTKLQDGGYRVSVRAPMATKQGAAALCSQFPTGGGREGAAGINLLSEDLFKEFVEKFTQAYK